MRSICEASCRLIVALEHGGDWSATLVDGASRFADFYDPVDPYPAEMWAQVTSHFAGGSESDLSLPGSRYECARVLKAAGVPFVQGLSLGQVCHVVQLAISARNILGYVRGHIVPYRFSHSQAKAVFAERQLQYSDASGDGCAPVSWDALVPGVLELLTDAGPGGIGLANLKHVFCTRFGKQISETALGYAKLSELLGDSRLRDLCEIRLQDSGYVVVLRRPGAGVGAAPHGAQPPGTMPPTPCGSVAAGSSCQARQVRRPSADSLSTSPGACASGSLTLPSGGRSSHTGRSCQVTLNIDDAETLWGAGTEGESVLDDAPVSEEEAHRSADGAAERGGSKRSGCRHWTTTSCPLERYGVSVRNTFIHTATPVPGSLVRRAFSLPPPSLRCA